MSASAVLVKLADARASLEIADPKLASDFLTRYTEQLAAANGHAVQAARTGIPRIGERWAGQGGVYASLCRGVKGEPDHHLIVHADEQASIKWAAAVEWAKALEADGLKDFSLPSRKEQAVLFGNVPELFKPEWYWSGEEHASGSDYAWFQYFDYGSQYNDHKDNFSRARAVRRLILR